jgi:hypothetical protein
MTDERLAGHRRNWDLGVVLAEPGDLLRLL